MNIKTTIRVVDSHSLLVDIPLSLTSAQLRANSTNQTRDRTLLKAWENTVSQHYHERCALLQSNRFVLVNN